MKLDEALRDAKESLSDYEHYGLGVATENLIAAIEEHLAVERRHADILLGLADLQRHGGE